MKQARALLVLFFVSLACSANSLPVEMLAKFFIERPAAPAAQLSTGGFGWTGSEFGMTSSSPGSQFVEADVGSACNFVLASVGTGLGVIPTLTISGSSTGTFIAALATPTNGSWPSNQIYYCTNFVYGGVATRFTSSGPGTWAIVPLVSSNGVPQFIGASQNGSSSWTTLHPGALTANGTNLYFASVTHDNGSGGYPDAGWTNIFDGGGSGGQDVPLGGGYSVTNATQNPTATNNAGGAAGVAVMVEFAAYGSAPPSCTPSYANQGTGNRSSLITVSDSFSVDGVEVFHAPGASLVDGVGAGNWFAGPAVAGDWFQFDYGSHTAWITEFEFTQSGATGQGVWQISGSTDGTTFLNIGTTFTLGGSTDQLITAPSANTTFYKVYRFTLITGPVSNGPFILQMNMKGCISP